MSKRNYTYDKAVAEYQYTDEDLEIMKSLVFPRGEGATRKMIVFCLEFRKRGYKEEELDNTAIATGYPVLQARNVFTYNQVQACLDQMHEFDKQKNGDGYDITDTKASLLQAINHCWKIKDMPNYLKALDLLAKIEGHYEKDNKQKIDYTPIEVKIME